jgi:hypothetical protein
MKHSKSLLLIIFSLLSFGATAQWAWTDEEGRTVFSDRAPAISVPDKRIFKRPGSAKLSPNQDAPANMGADAANAKMATPAQPAASAPQVTGQDKELAERKKKTEQAQVEQRKLEEERIRKAKADNCERARQAQKTLDSGVRLSRTNAKGEREILDDAARADEAKRIQSIVASDCN